MRGNANNAIAAVSQLPAGAGCQEKQNLPAKGEVFLLDIPFYRTRPDTVISSAERGDQVTQLCGLSNANHVPNCLKSEGERANAIEERASYGRFTSIRVLQSPSHDSGERSDKKERAGHQQQAAKPETHWASRCHIAASNCEFKQTPR